MTFDATSTADEVLFGIDLSGKTAIVTGASGGIGVESARALAAHGAHVVLAARDRAKLDAALTSIEASNSKASIEGQLLDLASLQSVGAFAAAFLASNDRLDLLLNNAGVMCTPFGHTADGFELQFGTNHLGHFLLTTLLIPALTESGDARVVNVTSAGHRFSDVDFDDPNFEHRDYDPWVSYGQSKTANILFAVALDQRLAAQHVRAFAVHPGGIRTELGRYMAPEDIARMTARIRDADTSGGGFQWKTVPQGAATSVWALTSPTLADVGGRYCEDCQLALPASAGSTTGYQPYAVDAASGERLWQLSERLIDEKGVS